jgi:hypothetical protein
MDACMHVSCSFTQLVPESVSGKGDSSHSSAIAASARHPDRSRRGRVDGDPRWRRSISRRAQGAGSSGCTMHRSKPGEDIFIAKMRQAARGQPEIGSPICALTGLRADQSLELLPLCATHPTRPRSLGTHTVAVPGSGQTRWAPTAPAPFDLAAFSADPRRLLHCLALHLSLCSGDDRPFESAG